MTDIVTPEVRSRIMAGIKGSNTRPEMVVRKGLHARGFRYRLNDRKLPGRPDLVLSKYNAVIFVNGCFWHGHECHLFKWPKTRAKFWQKKISRNVERDSENLESLALSGWRVGIVWECAIRGKMRRNPVEVIDRLSAWLMTGEKRLSLCGYRSR